MTKRPLSPRKRTKLLIDVLGFIAAHSEAEAAELAHTHPRLGDDGKPLADDRSDAEAIAALDRVTEQP